MPSKETLFTQGAAAAHKVFGTQDIYVCPLCGIGYGREALRARELTREHAPPRSQAGKAILLTCRRCNNSAGYRFDPDAAIRERFETARRVMVDGEPGMAGAFRMRWGGETLNVEVTTDAEGVGVIHVIERRNNPATVQSAVRSFTQTRSEGRTVGYELNFESVDRCNLRLAHLSDLRVAFLLCTAKFGYRYALHPCLTLIRDQIQRPDQILVERWWGNWKEMLPRRSIMIHEEEGLVTVGWGKRSIHLPWPTQSIENYLRRMEEMRTRGQVTLKIHGQCDWPTCFEAVIDHRIAAGNAG